MNATSTSRIRWSRRQHRAAESSLLRPDPSAMCPPGFALVRGYTQNRSGKPTPIHGYRRRVPERLGDLLHPESLNYLYWNSGVDFPPLKIIVGYEDVDDGSYDPVIQFWLDYWRSKGIALPGVDPLLIKAIIAVESSFNPKAQPPGKRLGAAGLRQVTGGARRAMAGLPNKDGWREIRTNKLSVLRDDLDPVAGIAAGIRWLGHKFKLIPKGHPRTIPNLLRNYNDWKGGGKAYAKKVLDLYNKSK